MVTNFIYLSDSYAREFDALVVETDKSLNAVLLSTSVFYPGGGGQPQDYGTIYSENASFQVTRFEKSENRVWHVLDHGWIEKGMNVKGVLDWERRYKLMRTHTAMHILCGVIWRDYQAPVTGGQMEPLGGRMDFEFEKMNASLVHEIEEKINIEIQQERDIEVKILPREEAELIPDLIRTKVNLLPPGLTEIRIVDINGLDLQADGGTHVANTKEVGKINIYDYQSKGKINKRLKIKVLD